MSQKTAETVKPNLGLVFKIFLASRYILFCSLVYWSSVTKFGHSVAKERGGQKWDVITMLQGQDEAKFIVAFDEENNENKHQW